MTFQNITNNSSSTTQANENFDAVAAAGTYGKRAPAVAGLTWAFYGGRGFGNTIADGTVALTASTTNYVVANRTTGAVSASTSTTNWNDTTNYYRLHLIVTGASTITTATDYREFTGGSSPGSGMINPMTAAGDIIYGGAPSGGVAPPTRLAAGTNGYVLTLAAGVPTWAAAPGGFSNPMTTAGDLILGGASGAPGRLGVGADGQVLTVTAGAVGWAASASGFANPMTTVGDLIVGSTGGSAVRLAAGTSGYVLTSTGAGSAPTWQAASGGGLTGFTSSLNTTTPNNTINASVLAASGGTTSQDVVISPKGSSGAFILGPAPDGTATGGNKRGAGAVDFSIRASAAQVASGANSFSAGSNNTVSGIGAVAIGVALTSSNSASFATGTSGTASGANSAVFGSSSQATAAASVAMGASTRATASAALATGTSTLADGANATAFGSLGTSRTTSNSLTLGASTNTNLGNQQYRLIPLVGKSTSATPIELTSDGSGTGTTTNRIALPLRSAFAIEVDVCAYVDPSTAQSWKLTALVRQGGSSPAVFVGGSPTSTIVFGDAGASSWTAVLSINGSSVILTATGAASTTVVWSAMARIVESATL